MSPRITDTTRMPPSGGPVKLPAVMPLPVPDSRREQDAVELSKLGPKRNDALVAAEKQKSDRMLESRRETRRVANLDPIEKDFHRAEREPQEKVFEARLEDRRQANLAPTTTESAKVQAVGNKETLARIDVHG